MAQIAKALLLMACVPVPIIAGCSAPAGETANQVDIAGAKRAVATVEGDWNRAFHSKNLEALVAPYASDAVFVLPGMPPQVGSRAIRDVYAKALKDPNFDVTLTSERMEIAQAGDLAVSQGHLSMKGSDPVTKQSVVTMTGSYVTVFRKQADGSWKAIQDWVAADPPEAKK